MDQNNRLSLIKNYWNNVKKKFPKENSLRIPTMRVVHIEKDKTESCEVTIQIINKDTLFKAKPEKLLADDHLVDQFSSRDIRALTYLGYLEMSAPKFKILAQQLSENNDQMLFAVRKKGEQNCVIKTAREISSNAEMLENLNQKDAHMIGFIAATEQQAADRQQMNQLKDVENNEQR